MNKIQRVAQRLNNKINAAILQKFTFERKTYFAGRKVEFSLIHVHCRGKDDKPIPTAVQYFKGYSFDPLHSRFEKEECAVLNQEDQRPQQARVNIPHSYAFDSQTIEQNVEKRNPRVGLPTLAAKSEVFATSAHSFAAAVAAKYGFFDDPRPLE